MQIQSYHIKKKIQPQKTLQKLKDVWEDEVNSTGESLSKDERNCILGTWTIKTEIRS